jgi:hypothetical protein
LAPATQSTWRKRRSASAATQSSATTQTCAAARANALLHLVHPIHLVHHAAASTASWSAALPAHALKCAALALQATLPLCHARACFRWQRPL